MNRRAFLATGAVAGGMALGTAFLLRPSRRRGATGTPLHVFSDAEAATLAAVATRMIAPLDAQKLGVVSKIDSLLAGAEGVAQHDFKQLLWLFDSSLAALAFDGRWTPFHELSAADQDIALAQWRDSRIPDRRSGFQALQRLCLAVTYADASVYPGIGYPGPPILVRTDGSRVGGLE